MTTEHTGKEPPEINKILGSSLFQAFFGTLMPGRAFCLSQRRNTQGRNSAPPDAGLQNVVTSCGRQYWQQAALEKVIRPGRGLFVVVPYAFKRHHAVFITGRLKEEQILHGAEPRVDIAHSE